MKIIFLDFDGVLNSEASFRMEIMKKKRLNLDTNVSNTLSEVACANLQALLCNVKDAQIVVSSTWRKLHSLEELKAILNAYGVDGERLIDVTPAVLSGHRGHEIDLWLEAHLDVLHFVILDDDRDAGASYPDKFVQTHWQDGLLFRDILMAQDILVGAGVS